MLPITRRANGGWGPMGDMLNLRRDMENLLDTFGYGRGSESAVVWAPPINVREDGEQVYVEAELPGVRPDDVEISVENGMLTISGEKHAEQEQKEASWHVVERRYGRFERSFTLARAVDVDNIKASFRDGVLRITMPKREEAKPRRIRVDAGRDANTPA